MKFIRPIAIISVRSLLFLFLFLSLTATSVRAAEIHDATVAGDLNKVRSLIEADPTLLESKDNNDDTPLHKACFAGQVAVANFLIDKGATTNVRDKFRQTPLHRACYVPDTDLTLVKRLIDKGADVNMQGTDRSAPLHWAAYRGGLAVAKLLIDHCADVNAQGYNGISSKPTE
jgi:ankyrin repeat protein